MFITKQNRSGKSPFRERPDGPRASSTLFHNVPSFALTAELFSVKTSQFLIFGQPGDEWSGTFVSETRLFAGKAAPEEDIE